MYYFHVDFIKEPLSLALQNVMTVGRIVTLDEKLKYYSGCNSPCLTFCPSKPDGSGHWISQLGVILHRSELPYVFGIFPKSNCVEPNELCSMTDIVRWAASSLKPSIGGTMPTLVMDARYLCKRGKGAPSHSKCSIPRLCES